MSAEQPRSFTLIAEDILSKNRTLADLLCAQHATTSLSLCLTTLLLGVVLLSLGIYFSPTMRIFPFLPYNGFELSSERTRSSSPNTCLSLRTVRRLGEWEIASCSYDWITLDLSTLRFSMNQTDGEVTAHHVYDSELFSSHNGLSRTFPLSWQQWGILGNWVTFDPAN